MSGALEGHRLEDDEPLRIPAALLEYYKLCGQKSDKVTPTSTYRHVIPPCGHDLQGSPEGLPHLVILDPLTEVLFIVRVHPVPVYLPNQPVLPRGHVLRKIPCGPLPVLYIVCILTLRCRRFDRVCLT